MRTTILTLALFLISLTPLSAQWEIINDGSDLKGFLNTIDFVNENVGWIGGDNGTLLKTTDGGENWNAISINESWNIKQIDFINESTGWAIGWSGVYPNYTYPIWKSSNGGETWLQQFSSSSVEFNSLNAIDENNVYAVGSNKIYKTTNGGTWVNVSPNLPDRNYNSVWFQDSQTGVVVGKYNSATGDVGCVSKTTNGGTNWIETIVNEFNSIYDLQFLDSNNGYFRAHKDTTHFLCKTTNMGTSWIIITAQNWGYQPIRSYQFLNNNTAYAIMQDSTLNVAKSTDGGIDWTKIHTSEGAGFSKILIINSTRGFILGNISFSNPLILRTKDEGYNWSIIRISYPINDIYCINNEKYFITGGFREPSIHGYNEYSNIFCSSDAGITWRIKSEQISTYGKSLHFVNNSIGFALMPWYRGGDTKIYRTTDVGENWNMVYSNNPDSTGLYFRGYDINFLNELVGFVVGGESPAGILTTTDGGDNWDLNWTDSTGGCLNSICFTSSTGFTVGESGMIVKYTPQTGWVQQTSVTDLPLNKVFFSDEYNGWIAGGYQNENGFQTILLKTTNGGVNWVTVPNVPYLIRDIVFIDNNFGWAIGYTQAGIGGILKTTDGGNSWFVDTGNLSGKLNALFIKDNYGWAVGENGLILRTTDAGAVWVEEDQTNYPTEFALEQNYPNPFNPSTSIHYAISNRQFVRLIVYDLLGREVVKLVNEEQPAGNYEVEFNPESSIKYPASGIYFYRLTAGSYSSTKKMLLLK